MPSKKSKCSQIVAANLLKMPHAHNVYTHARTPLPGSRHTSPSSNHTTVKRMMNAYQNAFENLKPIAL